MMTLLGLDVARGVGQVHNQESSWMHGYRHRITGLQNNENLWPGRYPQSQCSCSLLSVNSVF